MKIWKLSGTKCRITSSASTNLMFYSVVANFFVCNLRLLKNLLIEFVLSAKGNRCWRLIIMNRFSSRFRFIDKIVQVKKWRCNWRSYFPRAFLLVDGVLTSYAPFKLIIHFINEVAVSFIALAKFLISMLIAGNRRRGPVIVLLGLLWGARCIILRVRWFRLEF